MVYGDVVIGDLTISKYCNETTKLFTIHKLENQKYFLKFQHYGLKTKNITICLYLNNILIYTIDSSNSHHINNKPYPNVTLDVSSDIINGKNNITLRLVKGNLGNGWGYKISNAIIYTSSMKLPPPYASIIISILGIIVTVLKYSSKNLTTR